MFARFPAVFRPLRRIAFVACLPVLIHAAQPGRRSFDIPAGDAASTLKRFASQSEQQVAFPPNVVRGVRTNKIKGELSAREALTAMTEGTALVVVEDATSGALSVRRESRAQFVAQSAGDDLPSERMTAKNVGGRIQLEEYEVHATKIGGLNNRSLLPAHEEAALPFNVVSRADIERMGVTNMEEFFGHLPQAVNYGTNSQQQIIFSSTVGAQSYSVAAVDMGFGSDQTVVLVNGRRLGQGTSFAGADISRIPLSSIDRVEVLPAASAAIYGGGGVGGAINIILRKDYDVREFTTYLGTATNGGGTSFRISYIDGRRFNDGRTKLTTTLEFSEKQGVQQGQRNFLRRAMEKYGPQSVYQVLGLPVFEAYMLPFFADMPGTIVRAGGGSGLGIPGNPTARYAGIPPGLTAAQANALTPASFAATAGQPNLGGRHDRAYLIRPQTNYSVGFQLEHEILTDERLEFYSEAQFAYQTASISYPQNFNLTLAAEHPFNPFRHEVTPGFVGSPVLVFIDFADIDDPDTAQERHDARVTFGLKGKLRENWEWSLDASGQYARLYSDSNNPSNYFQLLLNAIARPSSASLADRWAVWNPFVDHTMFPVSREVHDRLFVYNRKSSFYNRNAQLALRVQGELWEVPAGPIRFSSGGDLRANQYNSFSKVDDSQELRAMAAAIETNTPFISNRSDTSRSVFIETTLPLFNEKWSPIGVQSFEIGASRRWSQSNRGRNTISSTICGNVWLSKDVMLRASLSEGFSDLAEEDITDPVVQENFVTNIVDPLRGNVFRQVTLPIRLSGGNPLLRTPSARSVNFGTVLKPRFIPGLTLNVNYTTTERVDSVATPVQLDLFTFPHDYPGRVQRAPLTAEDVALGYTGGAITRLDLTRINLAQRSMESFSYEINYRLPIPSAYGTVNWTTTATHINSLLAKPRPTSAPINHAGTRGALKWKGNSGLYWSSDRWSAGVTGYYINSYYDATTAPTPAIPTATGLDGRKIKHSLLFDLRGGYRFPAGNLGDHGWKTWLNGTTINVGVQNVFDRMSALVTDGSGFYSRFTSPMQRFVYLEVKKTL